MNWKQVTKLEFTEEEMEIINFYCGNEMRELKKICSSIIAKNNIDKIYYDDLYSDALIVLMESIKDFNGEKAVFKTFLIGNINRSFLSWIRDNYYRAKRSPLLLDSKGKIVKVTDENEKEIPVHLKTISFDEPTEDEHTLKEIIPDKIDVKEDEIEFSPKVKQYLHNLSNDQLEVAYLIMEGQSQENIKEILNLTQSEFNNCMNGIKAYENISILF